MLSEFPRPRRSGRRLMDEQRRGADIASSLPARANFETNFWDTPYFLVSAVKVPRPVWTRFSMRRTDLAF